MRISDWSSDVCSSDLFTIRDGRVRARIQQQAHDRLVALAAVAKDHRLEQRRPCQAIDVVRVDASLDQPAHRFDVAALRSDERRVGKAGVSTGSYRGAQDQYKQKHKQNNEIRYS